MQRAATYRFLFASALFTGNEAFFMNLREALGGRDDIQISWLPIELSPGEWFSKIPPVSMNFSLKNALVARSRIRALERSNAKFDAAFINHVTPAYFLRDFMKRVPTVLSLDVTPRLLDKYSAWYETGSAFSANGLLERFKRGRTREVYMRSAGLPFLYVDMILGTTFLSSDRQKSLVVISIAAIPVNVLLNYLLIPYTQSQWANGGIGTGIATVITEMLIMVSMLSILPRGVLRGFRVLVPIKSALAGVCMASSVILARALNLHWTISAVVAAMVYVGAVLILRVFDAPEKELLRQLIINGGFRKILILFRPVESGGADMPLKSSMTGLGQPAPSSSGMSAVPPLSVGLPVYNGEKYLSQAVEAILSQSFRDFELIISDNCSTDGTRKICETYARKDPRVRYVRNDRNLGVAANYNNTVRLARGEFFKWATYDDITGPGFFEQCLEVMRQEPEIILCYPRTRIIDNNNRPLRNPDSTFWFRSPKPYVRFGHALEALRDYECEALYGVMRRSLLLRTGMIQNYHSSDRVLLAELTLHGETCEIPDRLFYHRVHPEISTRPGMTTRQLAVWFNPANKGKIFFPKLRRFVEFIKAVNRAGLSFFGRAYCYIQVLWFYTSGDKWMRLMRRMKSVHGLTNGSRAYLP